MSFILPSTTYIYTLSLHDALPILANMSSCLRRRPALSMPSSVAISSSCETCNAFSSFKCMRERKGRSEEHTSELQSRGHLVCRLLLEKKKKEHNRTLRQDNNDVSI